MIGQALAELFVKISTDMSGLKDGFKEAEKSTKQFGDKFKKAGLGMMAVGAGITAALGATAVAAEEERVGIMRLSQTLKNVGVEYDNVKDSLEGVIAATQRKTGIADSDQRDALGALIVTTNDYQKSLELLPLVLDLATAKQIDLKTSAELVGRVAEGNLGTLSRYGIVLQEGATAAEALAELQKRVAGTAEAAASPIEILKAGLSDVTEEIGMALLPAINTLLKDRLIPLISKLGEWISQNPQLIRTIGAFALVLIGAGGLLYALNAISKAVIAVNAALIIMHGLTGVGLLKAAAGLAAAAGLIFGMTKMVENAIPQYATGGIVPGAVGQPQLAMVHGGETIIPPGGAGGINVVVNVAGTVTAERDLAQTIRRELLFIQDRNYSTGIA